MFLWSPSLLPVGSLLPGIAQTHRRHTPVQRIVVKSLRREELQRDRLFQAEDTKPHPALAELAGDLAVADGGAEHDAQIVPLPDTW